ncbi:hypothetical protein HKX48_004947 [Thoreauomyces humboldtii]|nr:hypothetical protein HKX48_004947 [Thoreauomyces humboldtii]
MSLLCSANRIGLGRFRLDSTCLRSVQTVRPHAYTTVPAHPSAPRPPPPPPPQAKNQAFRQGSHTGGQSLKVDVPLYDNADQTFYRVAYFCAGGQMLLWLTFADWCWRELRVAEVDSEGKKRYVLAPRWERNGAALFCLGVGGLFAAAVQLWTSRRIRSLTLLKGGQYVGIDTSNILGRNRLVLPTRSLRTWERAVTDSTAKHHVPKPPTTAAANGYIILKPQSHKTGFMIDKGGEFADRKLFDTLFYRAR